MTIPSQIIYQGYTYVLGGSTVQFTTTPYRDHFTFFGPNFQLEHAPEPMTFALTGIGLILLSLSGRILRRKTQSADPARNPGAGGRETLSTPESATSRVSIPRAV